MFSKQLESLYRKKLIKGSLIELSSGENKEHGMVTCCVMNCQEEIPIENAIKIMDKYFCKICGVAYYRSNLNL